MCPEGQDKAPHSPSLNIPAGGITACKRGEHLAQTEPLDDDLDGFLITNPKDAFVTGYF